MEKHQFGFGCMRLPLLDKEDNTSFDYPLIETLFDAYLEAGFTYFDTAYTYHGYHAEEAMRKALVERHPRDSFELATKFPLRDFKDEADLEVIFNRQLSNCGVEYFDYYLLHNIGTNVYSKAEEYGVFDFVKRKKAEGKIRHLGFSFHDSPAMLEDILSKYGDGFGFIQLQINYLDWNNPIVQSRRCLEVANEFKKPVFVMEPCKGGTLANLPKEAEDLYHAYNPEASNASWAFRFAASQEGVVRVLSGMNSLGQLTDNIKTFKNFIPLNSEELDLIKKGRAIIEKKIPIGCTACGYCLHGCPKHIAIPKYFSLYNNAALVTGGFSSQFVYYNNLSLSHGKASECIGCRQCERACPQHLEITEWLKKVADKFENNSFMPSGLIKK